MSAAPLFAPRERPAVRTERGFVVTSAGVVIGRLHQAPARQVSADALAIQDALLAPRRRAARWVRQLAAGLAALSITRSTR
jgi:hypothetical protein